MSMIKSLDNYKKIDLMTELYMLESKITNENNSFKGIELLLQLRKSESINFPFKVERFKLINILIILSGIMGEEAKEFQLNAIEVFKIILQ